MAILSRPQEGLLLVGGEWERGDPAETLEDCDPGTGEVVGVLAQGGPDDVDRAVAAARRALPEWAAAAPGARAKYLNLAAARLEAEADEWAELMTLEMGKPLPEAKVECLRAARILQFFAGEAQRPFGEQYASDQAQTWLFTRREPVGVVGIITPWNFPAAIPAWKLAPALVFGNAVVIKFAEDGALTGLRLARALHDAGLPPGVMNVVLGPGSRVGAAIVDHTGIDAISFTGSTQVGRSILSAAAESAKKVQLEMGGHNPVVVRADADLDHALDSVVLGAFASAGQKCTATRRVYVARELYDEFVRRLVARAESLKIGHGLEEGTEMGPLVNEVQLEGVLESVARAEKQGTLRCGGRRLSDGDHARGFYMSPAVLTDLPHDAELASEEVFGPAVGVWPVDGDERAIELANRTRFGLSASIFTRDLDAAKRFVERVRAGIVHVNSQTAGADVHVPFGGLAATGYGPHEQGRAAIEFFTEQKTVYLDPSSQG
jgi:acyl-CoA reductase-like NAD-dependent aldehyde dehydrogenase